jgi:hypothetical protein
MYKVRNGSGGVLPIQLEKGAIMLQPGKTFDLDGVCSREFIRNDPSLQTLLNGNHLILIHDSEQGVPPQPTWDVMKRARRKPTTAPKPVVVDFSDVPDPEKELPLEVLVEKTKSLKEKPEEAHKCPECDRSFKTARGLMSHSRVHKNK